LVILSIPEHSLGTKGTFGVQLARILNYHRQSRNRGYDLINKISFGGGDAKTVLAIF